MHSPLETPKVLALVEEIKQAALQEHHASRPGDSHFRLLSLIDQLKLAVETPTETVLRLIYQVRPRSSVPAGRLPASWSVMEESCC